MVSNLHYYFLFYGRLLFFCPHRDTILEESFLWILYIFLSSAPFLNIFLILKATHLHIFHKKLTVRLQLHNNSHNSLFLTTVRRTLPTEGAPVWRCHARAIRVLITAQGGRQVDAPQVLLYIDKGMSFYLF